MQAIGAWIRLHKEAIIDCGPSKYPVPKDCRYTQNGKKLYLHVYSYPFKHIHLPEIADQVRFIRFLHDGSEIFIVALILMKSSLLRKLSLLLMI